MITYNIWGLDDLEIILQGMFFFINSLVPKVDVIMIHEHKLRGRLLENLGSRLMIGCASGILETTLGEQRR